MSSQQASTSVDMEGDHIPHRELRSMQVQVMAGKCLAPTLLLGKTNTHALTEQDSGLEELSKIIGRQKQMAQAIGNEVTSQNG